MLDWLLSIDGWTWLKFACLMAFAAGVGLLKRYQFDEELRHAREEEQHRERTGRFIDPFDG